MNKTEAYAKARTLANSYARPYAVVICWYGYDAEPHSALISPAELVEIIYPVVLTPADNTEARQQATSELEQAEQQPATADIIAFLDSEATDYRAYYNGPDLSKALADIELLKRTVQARPDGEIAKNIAADMRRTQPDMFAARVDDLPLFSGTAPRAHVRPFVETPARPRQTKLF